MIGNRSLSNSAHPESVGTIEPITVSGPIQLQAQPGPGQPEFRARLVRAGYTVRADGRRGDIFIPAETLQAAVALGQFNGLAVFADHPEPAASPSIKDLVGLTHSAVFDPATQAVNATLRFFAGEPAESLATSLALILADRDQGLAIPDIGLSLVFWPGWQPRQAKDQARVVAAFHKIDSADIVFGPAADGRILELLSSRRQVRACRPYSNPQGDKRMNETPINHFPAEDGRALAPEPDPAALAFDAWQAAAGREAAQAIIGHSGLPEASKAKLRRQAWLNPGQLEQAIADERAYLAALSQGQVIQLGGNPPRAGQAVQMNTGLDQVRNAVDWIFGTPEATTPEPQLRRLDLVYTLLTGDYEFHGVFRPERVYLASAETSTLAGLAANAMNKVIQAQLALLTHYRWYEFVVQPTPNDGSLHNMQWTSFGGIGTLPVVTEGGAYDELATDDVQESDAFYKYGGYVGITREMIKNSDIQRIQAVPRALAAAAVKTRSAKIASIFTGSSGAGPTLDQDSTALFHANHGNLATTALGSDTTAWKAAAIECFKQTEVNSADRIGVFPKYCLVPPDLYHAALSIFGYGDGTPTSYQPFSRDNGPGDPRPVPLAVPHFTDANDWAYIADPNLWPVIHMSFSADASGRTFPPPELWAATAETGGLLFSSDVLPIKIRDEFAYGVNGFRGIGKRNVA